MQSFNFAYHSLSVFGVFFFGWNSLTQDFGVNLLVNHHLCLTVMSAFLFLNVHIKCQSLKIILNVFLDHLVMWYFFVAVFFTLHTCWCFLGVYVGQLYGLEKFWAFLKYAKVKNQPIDPKLQEYLSKFKSIDDFRVDVSIGISFDVNVVLANYAKGNKFWSPE